MNKIGVAFGNGKAFGLPTISILIFGLLLFMAGRKSINF